MCLISFSLTHTKHLDFPKGERTHFSHTANYSPHCVFLCIPLFLLHPLFSLSLSPYPLLLKMNNNPLNISPSSFRLSRLHTIHGLWFWQPQPRRGGEQLVGPWPWPWTVFSFHCHPFYYYYCCSIWQQLVTFSPLGASSESIRVRVW